MNKKRGFFITAVILAFLTVLIWFAWNPLLDFLNMQGALVQGADSFLSILTALGSLASGIFWFFAQDKKTVSPPSAPVPTIDTGGGAYVGGSVDTSGGDFVGRDKNIENVNSSRIVTGSGNVLHDYDIYIDNSTNVTLAVERYLTSMSTTPPSDDLRAATQKYFDYLITRYRYLETKGFAVHDRMALQLPLLNLYVPLSARIEALRGERFDRETMLAGRNLKEGDEDAPALGGLQPVLELLKKHAGLIVLGDPGSGKTTFLKYLALRLASGTGQALELGDRLPILVPISAYANALDKNHNIRLDDFIVEYLHANGSNLPVAEMLKQAFQRGTALILLDGLDEVAKLSQRTQVVSRIVDFYAFHKPVGNKFVITSRIVGYREVRPAVDDLVEGTLADFDDDQIQLFLEHWSLTLEKQVYGDTDLARMNAQREKFVLWTAIQRNAGVRALASNPLLLTILALIKRQGVTLPERRVELYDLSLRTLLSTWNRARNVGGLSPGRDVDERQTIQVLAPLALWMHQTNIGVGLVRRRDLERQLQSLFEKRGDDPQHASELFMQDVHDFTGVLLERGPDEYGFIHLTFEEYLSAIAIAQKGQLDWKIIYDTLSKKIGDAAWHEISMLTIGYVGLIKGDDQVVGHIIDALLIEQPGEPGQAVLFAGEAVLDTQPRGVPPKIRQTVVDALVSTMQNSNVKPVFRRQAGLVLGELGWTPDDLDTFVEIAPGKFLYGEKKEECEIKQRYWIAKYPVSNLQYARFIKAGGYENKDWWSKEGWDWRTGNGRLQPARWDDREFANPLVPVVSVTWFEAQAYCAWRNKQSSEFEIPQGYLVRLPTEAEWERAARFTDGREYPWNAAFDPKFANTTESGNMGTTAVCTYPLGKSQESAWDLSGNVWEWSADWFEKGKYRSLRGGSWRGSCRNARCASRIRDIPDSFLNNFGFRCVVSLAIPES